MYDEKYKTWVNDPVFIYPSTDVAKQGIVIQQYIGLKDKDGKDIYEGDYINFSTNCSHPLGDADIVEWKNQVVHYNEELAGFYFGYKYEFQIIDNVMPETLEVVGNIFDTPELIEQ